MLKKTKIVATVGPSTVEKETLVKMIQEGVNVFRINFSHGNYDDHTDAIKKIKAPALMCVIFLDLMGGVWVVDVLATNVTNGRNFALTILR